jgi:hypothetical protein
LLIIRSVKLQITASGMVSCCSGGLAVRRAAAWSYVFGVKEDACSQAAWYYVLGVKKDA